MRLAWIGLVLILPLALTAQEEGRQRPSRLYEGPEPTQSSPNLRIEGAVRDALTGEPLAGAYIKLKGTLAGVVSGPDGRFILIIGSLPASPTIEVSFVGYESVEVPISGNQPVEIKMQESNLTLKEVVISTSRIPETVLEAPVTVSRMSFRDLNLNAGANLIQRLGTLKNIDVSYQSITFPSLNVRGFADPGNTRMVQRIDGIDMLAPIFGFPAGLLGVPPEIDLEAVEITAGPASAMYGPNAFNGMLEIHTRTPRQYPGLSALLKVGSNHFSSDTSPQPYTSFALRYARTIGDRFSFKIVGEYLRATDWMATNENDEGTYEGADDFYAVPGPQNPGYNAINRYGDEVRTLMDPSAFGISSMKKFYVARTGYRDRDLIDPNTFLQKYGLNFQYFLTEKFEISWRSFLANGNTIFQALNRNALRDVLFHQHKLELHTPEFLLRIYGSWEDAGKSYDSRFTGLFLNDWAKPNDGIAWFLGYMESYIQDSSHEKARIYADTATRFSSTAGTYRPRLEPGTLEFQRVMDEINSNPYRTQRGAGFFDRSSFYHGELQYDLSRHTRRLFDLLVGGNVRLYRINTRGSLLVDYEGPFWVHEYGGFAQMSRWLGERRWRLSGSLRYDKSQYFEGRFTPRVAVLWAFGLHRQHSLRASYQTGFRLPNLREQFIGLDIGFNFMNVGGTPRASTIFGLNQWRFSPASVEAYRAATKGVTDSAALAQAAQQHLKTLPTAPLRPEVIQNYEVGFRLQLLQGLYLDMEFARAYYTDFVIDGRVVAPRPIYEAGSNKPTGYNNIDPSTLEGLNNLSNGEYYTYSITINSPDRVYADYISAGIEYTPFTKMLWTFSYSYAWLNLSNVRDPSILPQFNTPRHKIGSSLYLYNLGRWSSSLSYRWIDVTEYRGMIVGKVPAAQWIDAQVGYSIPRYRVQLRLGAQNLLNVRYVQIPGGPRVGGLYYFQVVYDPVLSLNR